MRSSARLIAVVCIAVFALTAVAAAPMFALLDAQTPIDALFGVPSRTAAPTADDIALPAAPTSLVRSPRAPPLA